MTTPNQAREAIYQKFKDGWGTHSPFSFDDEAFTPPVQSLWVRLSVRHLNNAQDTLGSVGYRNFAASGRVFVQVFVPRGSGKKDSDAAVLKAKSILEAVKLEGGIDLFAATPRELGVAPGDAWDQTSVEIPFTYYETK